MTLKPKSNWRALRGVFAIWIVGLLVLTHPFIPASRLQLASTGAGKNGSGAAPVVTGDWLFVQGTSGGPSGASGSFQVQNACPSSGQSCTIHFQPTKAGSTREYGCLTDSANNGECATVYECTNPAGCNAGNALATATLCPTLGCHINAQGVSTDLAYVVNGPAGATYATANLVATSSTGLFVEMMEMLPPLCNGVPCTTSVDANVTLSAASGTCTSGCTIANSGMSLTATDGIMGMINSGSTVGGFVSPYQIDSVGNVFAVDTNSAPNYQIKTSNYLVLSNIAFKSSAGTFSPSPAAIFSNRYQAPNDTVGNGLVFQLVCTGGPPATCPALTLPGTTVAGNLLTLFNGPNSANATISTIANGGTWVIPSGANTCANTTVSGNPLQCGYVLSSTASATTLAITTSVACTCNFIFLETSRSSGSFVLDAQNSSSVGTGVNPVVGQTLSLTGTMDVCFAEAEWTPSTPFEFLNQYYPLPGGRNEFGLPGSPVGGVVGMAMNVRSFQTQNVLLSATPTNSTTSAICFK